MNEILKALFEPQVVVAFITFVLGPAVGVIWAAKKESPPTKPAEKPRATGERRVRREDNLVVEAFAKWANEQSEEIDKLRGEIQQLRIELSQVKNLNNMYRQHNNVLIQQLQRLGETPFSPPRLDS